MLVRVTVFSFVLFLASIEMSGSGTMTLRDCMEYAVSNSTKIHIQQAEISDRRLEIRDAILSTFTPSVGASTSGYYSFGRNIDPQTNTYFNQTSFHNNYSVSASINLFDGLASINNIKISKTGLMISQSREQQMEADICLAVMETYYNVVYYKRLAEVYEAQIATAEKSLGKARLQEELGQKGYADVVEMEAELASIEYDHTTTRNQYLQYLLELEALIFWHEEEELEIDCSLPGWVPEIFDEETIINYATGNNPEIKIAEGNIKNSKREYLTAQLQLLPSLDLYGGWSTSYYTISGYQSERFKNQFTNNAGEYIQLSLSLPLYDGLKNISRIKKKKNAVIVARSEYEQKVMDISNEIRRALQDYEGSSTSYSQGLKKSLVQEEAYRLNLKKLEQGLISPLEFQTANNNYLKAKADEMNSLFQCIIKQAVVKYYSGIDYVNQF